MLKKKIINKKVTLKIIWKWLIQLKPIHAHNAWNSGQIQTSSWERNSIVKLTHASGFCVGPSKWPLQARMGFETREREKQKKLTVNAIIAYGTIFTVFVKLTFALSIAHVFCNYTELSILTNINDCNHVIGSAVYGLGTRFF